jgi:hypothetical protein
MSNAKGPGFMEGGKFAHRRLSAPGIEGSATDSPAFDALVLLSEARQWLRLFERDAGPEIRRGDLADLLARIDAAFGLAQPVAAPDTSKYLTGEQATKMGMQTCPVCDQGLHCWNCGCIAALAQPVAAPEPLHGFSREDLEAVAEGLESQPQTVNVGNATGEGDDHLPSTAAVAAKFIRAILATQPGTEK